MSLPGSAADILRNMFTSKGFWFAATVIPAGGLAGFWLRGREEESKIKEAAKTPLSLEEEAKLMAHLVKQRETRRKQLLIEQDRVEERIREMEEKIRVPTSDSPDGQQ